MFTPRRRRMMITRLDAYAAITLLLLSPFYAVTHAYAEFSPPRSTCRRVIILPVCASVCHYAPIFLRATTCLSSRQPACRPRHIFYAIAADEPR